MAEVITMPRLSDTMTEGKVSKWHKKVGDTVKEGDVLAEIETDKAVQDFESEFNGTLLYIGTEEGSNSPVDSVLAIIGNAGEDISGLVSGGNSAPQTEEKKEEVAVSATEVSAVSAEIPAGVEVITMPRLSDTMTEGKVAKWHKNIGDDVKEGDILAEIETDKAVQDFESEFKGTLLYQGVSEGNATNVDEILAIIGPAGTDVSLVQVGEAWRFVRGNKVVCTCCSDGQMEEWELEDTGWVHSAIVKTWKRQGMPDGRIYVS